MKKIIAILIFAILLLGCGDDKDSITPQCRHYSVLRALTFSENYVVRIAYGKNSTGATHSQAQALIDGKWKWLQNDEMPVYVGEQEVLTIAHYVPIEKALDWTKQIKK